LDEVVPAESEVVDAALHVAMGHSLDHYFSEIRPNLLDKQVRAIVAALQTPHWRQMVGSLEAELRDSISLEMHLIAAQDALPHYKEIIQGTADPTLDNRRWLATKDILDRVLPKTTKIQSTSLSGDMNKPMPVVDRILDAMGVPKGNSVEEIEVIEGAILDHVESWDDE